MWASKGVRKCATLYYKEVLYEPVIPETGEGGVRVSYIFYLSGRAFFPKPMLSGEFP